MFAGKPIIGIVGGVGSGKSFVAKRFGELGCVVIDSDAQVRDAYRDPAVKRTIRGWWGDSAFAADGEVDRRAIAARVFADPEQRRRLEGLLHPWVAEARDRVMAARASDPGVVAFVWDTPLLLEAGLRDRCDAVVFVDAPEAVREARVREARGWQPGELARREKSQLPLDTKRGMSDDVIRNTADADHVRGQVREALSRIVSAAAGKPGTGREGR